MEKRYQQKQTRDIPTSKTSRSKSFDIQRSSLQGKDVEPSRPQNKPEAARTSTSNPKDLKQTRDIPTSKTSRPKSFNMQRSSLQPKDIRPLRLQNKPEAGRASTPNPKDLKSKPDKHSASNSRQKQNSSAQLGWRQAVLRHSSSMSSLGGRSFNPNLRRKLAGGGDGEETSEQQTHNPSTEERVYSHEPSGHEAWTQSRQQDPQDRSATPEPSSNTDLLDSIFEKWEINNSN